jgi:hypothetical protein
MTSLKLNFIKTTALAIKKPRIRIFRTYYGGQITAKRKKFSVFSFLFDRNQPQILRV